MKPSPAATIPQDIFNLAISSSPEDLSTLSTLLDKWKKEGVQITEDPGNDVGAALSHLATTNQTDLAAKLIQLIDVEALKPEQHFEMLWGVTNPRRAGGESDPSFITLKNMIEAGFNIAAQSQGRDLFSEAAKQISHHDTDTAILILLLGTGVPGFEKDLSQDILEELVHEGTRERALLNLKTLEQTYKPAQRGQEMYLGTYLETKERTRTLSTVAPDVSPHSPTFKAAAQEAQAKDGSQKVESSTCTIC